ncbi:DNA mismatch endonuclease (patch repair protein) [Xanthomonas arboricola]|uniref:very short patch repair endonuclease n=1 Tax=Xanthomonas euvesicatoria TaxID=456327 RepID=UPI001621C713|nr:very short patch repair endonuclease [Xanthomonas euvesicatoria]MBV6829684.1 very short patch repair endonuclease [Xanthomonas campestris pv. viegasii]
MDRLTPERRSWLMSRVKSKDTKPELLVRRLVFRMGYRYRLHGKSLPGKPDLVFPSRHKVIFVHGCFWHGHEGCRLSRTPKTNADFWLAKLVANRERDARIITELDALGWTSLTVWQCELRDPEAISVKIHEYLESENK